ncbi:hypothetical protein ABZ914_14725, partial [Spirillospora sp. NPDC046719]
MPDTVARCAIASGCSRPTRTCGARRSTSSRSPTAFPPMPDVSKVRATTHRHPGPAFGYVLEGEMLMELEGQP